MLLEPRLVRSTRRNPWPRWSRARYRPAWPIMIVGFVPSLEHSNCLPVFLPLCGGGFMTSNGFRWQGLEGLRTRGSAVRADPCIRSLQACPWHRIRPQARPASGMPPSSRPSRSALPPFTFECAPPAPPRPSSHRAMPAGGVECKEIVKMSKKRATTASWPPVVSLVCLSMSAATAPARPPRRRAGTQR